MPLFGKSTIGASSETISADEKRFCKFSVGGSGTVLVSRIFVYANRTATGNGYQITGAIYTDNSGSPGTLVPNSEVTISTNISRNSPQWYSATYANAPQLTSGQNYWIGVHHSKAGVTYFDAGTTNQEASATDVLPLDTNFGTSTFHSHEMSTYVESSAPAAFDTAIRVSGVSGSIENYALISWMEFSVPPPEPILAELAWDVRTRGQATIATSYGVWIRGQALSNTGYDTRTRGQLSLTDIREIKTRGQAASDLSHGVRATGRNTSVDTRIIRAQALGITTLSNVTKTIGEALSVRSNELRVIGQSTTNRTQIIRITGESTAIITPREVFVTGYAQAVESFGIRTAGIIFDEGRAVVTWAEIELPPGVPGAHYAARNIRTIGIAASEHSAEVYTTGEATDTSAADVRVTGEAATDASREIHTVAQAAEVLDSEIRITGELDSEIGVDVRANAQADTSAAYLITLETSGSATLAANIVLVSYDTAAVESEIRTVAQDDINFSAEIKFSAEGRTTDEREARITGYVTVQQGLDARITAQATAIRDHVAKTVGQATSALGVEIAVRGEDDLDTAQDIHVTGQADVSDAYEIAVYGVIYSEEIIEIVTTGEADEAIDWYIQTVGEIHAAESYEIAVSTPLDIYAAIWELKVVGVQPAGSEVAWAIRVNGVKRKIKKSIGVTGLHKPYAGGTLRRGISHTGLKRSPTRPN